jgi:hypothetical protein
MAKRGDKIECKCGRVIEASCIKWHLKFGISHAFEEPFDVDARAAELFSTSYFPNLQLKIDFKALAAR